MRYYFNVRDGDTYIQDPEGSELGSTEAAIDEAKANAREMMAERLRTGEILNGQVFEVTTETGEIIGKVSFKDALL